MVDLDELRARVYQPLLAAALRARVHPVTADLGWNPDLHPRGKDGKFITIDGFVELFGVPNAVDGDRGRVRDIIPMPGRPGDPDIIVNIRGRDVVARANQLSEAPPERARLPEFEAIFQSAQRAAQPSQPRSTVRTYLPPSSRRRRSSLQQMMANPHYGRVVEARLGSGIEEDPWDGDGCDIAAAIPVLLATATENWNAAKRKKAANKGQALKDGSFPIADCRDVEKAVKAMGRSSHSVETVKRHIKKRARALGCSKSLPESWK